MLWRRPEGSSRLQADDALHPRLGRGDPAWLDLADGLVHALDRECVSLRTEREHDQLSLVVLIAYSGLGDLELSDEFSQCVGVARELLRAGRDLLR